MSRPSDSFAAPPPTFTLNPPSRQILTRKLAAQLLKPLSDDHLYRTIILSGSAFGDAAATVAGPLLLSLARRQCLHTVILSDIIASLPVDEALRSLSTIASSIGTYKGLRAVDLSHNAIGTLGMAHCAPLLDAQPNLNIVNLENTGLSADAARLLSEYLTHSVPTALNAINIHRNRLDSDGLLHITNVVSKSPNLQCLRVSAVGAFPPALTSLSKALLSTPDIRELDISDNGFDATSAQALVAALASMPRLVRLVLSDLNLTNAHVSEIVQSILSAGAPLAELLLANNEFTSEAAQSLVQLFATDTAVKIIKLDVSINDLGDDGVDLLAESVASASPQLPLSQLSVSQCDLSPNAIARLATSMLRLPEVVSFDFTENEVPPAVSRRIAAVFPPGVVAREEDEEDGVDIEGLMGMDIDADDASFANSAQSAGGSGQDDLETALQALETMYHDNYNELQTQGTSPQRLVTLFDKEAEKDEEMQSEDTRVESGSSGTPSGAVQDESRGTENNGVSDGTRTPPPSRFLGASSLSMAVTPGTEGATNLREDDAGSSDGSVMLSARKLKETIVSLSKEISDVAGELQTPVEATGSTTGTSTGAVGDEEDVSSLLLGGREATDGGKPSVLGFVIDLFGGCVVAVFVVVLVLAIAQTQEESTFSYRQI